MFYVSQIQNQVLIGFNECDTLEAAIDFSMEILEENGVMLIEARKELEEDHSYLSDDKEWSVCISTVKSSGMVNTCKFVDSFTLLEPLGRPAREAVMTHFGETQEWCWGSNNRSMISKDDFITALSSIDEDDLIDDDLLPITKDNIGMPIKEAIAVIVKRMEPLPAMCYIDLEN